MDKKTLIRVLAICGCGIIIFSMIAIWMAQDKFGDGENSGGGAYINDDGTLIVPEGSDYLPESSVGSWQITEDAHVLQSPRNSEISEEDAIKAEYDADIMLAYDCFRTGRISDVISPCYKVETGCKASVLDEAGIQSDGVLEEFGEDASIVKIDVYEQDGKTLADTVFIINETNLVYYGTGNFVFAATKVEAVG